MYNDGVITNEFTGYWDGVENEYVYPTAPQNFAIKFKDFYLSAADGDFTTDGISIHTTTGEGPDRTIGNATSAVLTATILNPAGYMETLDWGDGKAYLGVVTSVTTTTAGAGDLFYIEYNGNTLAATASRFRQEAGGSTYSAPITGEPLGLVVDAFGDAAYLYTDSKMYKVVLSTHVITEYTPGDIFNVYKYRNLGCSVIIYAATGIPTIISELDAETGDVKVSTYTYVPMGTFDFSNVDAYGPTFVVEAYDRMPRLDADATDWVANLDFSTPKTARNLANEIGHELGITFSGAAVGAVNNTFTYSSNPITSYTVTYRQIIKWLSESMGCNAFFGRDGNLIFRPFFPGTSVATVTPNTIISQTRTKNHYAVPAITQLVAYNTLGAGYSVGVEGSTLYIVGNPFVDPSGSLTPITSILNQQGNIPAYYPTTLSVAHYDPRIDVGDFITVQSPDGLSSYMIPVMEQTIYWNGICRAEVVAFGQQQRSVPESMESSDLSSVVDSNPVAVINKIEAVGISADWITTGKLTVLDANDDILFEADKDNHAVQMAGFTAEDDALTASTSKDINGVTHTINVKVKTDEIELGDYWNNTSSQILHLDRAAGYIYNNDSSVSNRESFAFGGGYVDTRTPAASTDNYAGEASLNTILPGHLGSTPYYNAVVSAKAGGSGVKTEMYADHFEQTPYDLGNGNSMRKTSFAIYSLAHSTSSTTLATYTATIPDGLYLVIHTRYTTPVAAATGMQLMQIGTSSTTARIDNVGTPGNDIGAADTATYCSTVAVTAANDGTGTVTWTVKGRSFRRLYMIRLL